MSDTELFLSLAEIAGVFVGFGALIAVRSGSSAETRAISSIRWVMSSAIWCVFAALAPVIASRYGVGGRELWAGCGILALACFAVVFAVNGRAPENLAEIAEARGTTPVTLLLLVYLPTFWLPVISLVLGLALVALGIVPGHDEAIYLTAVGLGLFSAAIVLLGIAFAQRDRSIRPQS